jgi:hypothetical protein
MAMVDGKQLKIKKAPFAGLITVGGEGGPEGNSVRTAHARDKETQRFPSTHTGTNARSVMFLCIAWQGIREGNQGKKGKKVKVFL